MRITRRQLKRIIKEYGSGYSSNSPPSKQSNWRGFADALDIGVLDLDEIAYDLGFQDFRDMDASITPDRLSKRDPGSFLAAVRNFALSVDGLDDREILQVAGTPSDLLDRDSLVRRTTY